MLNLLNQCEKRLKILITELEVLKEKEETSISVALEEEVFKIIKIIDALYISLIQMATEPYYTHFFKTKYGCPTENYCIKYLNDDPIILFHNQDDFLIEANGLLETFAVNISGEGDGEMAYINAFRRITQYLENESLWEIINNPNFNLNKDRLKIYDWMQKNYGNYKIKKIW